MKLEPMYTPVLKPYKHQTKALSLMAGRAVFALLMAMRTGKTKTIVDDWGRKVLEGKLQDLLYIAPAGALYGQDALETQLPQHVPTALGAQFGVWRSGMGKTAKKELLKLLETDGVRVLLVNVEALSTVEEARELCRAFLARGRATFVVGESTCIKNNSIRSKQVMKLRELAVERRIETGLVTPQSPLDLYYQFYFLDPKILGFKSYFGFRARYAVLRKMYFGGRKVTVVATDKAGRPMYRYMDELREKIAPHSFRVQLEDCYDVPKKMYLLRDVELTDEQRRICREVKEFATAKLESGTHVTAGAVITQLLRVHQVVCGYVVDEEGDLHAVPERRTASLMDLLDEYEGKAVIWCSYDYNVQRLSEVLQNGVKSDKGKTLRRGYGVGSVARFWGGNRATREEEERRFKSDPSCRFMLATPGAGGKGREWSVADLAVYYSNSPNLEHREQSEERISAIGKKRPRTYVDMRAPESAIDDKFIVNLRAKINIASALQGDKYREWLI